MSLLGKLRTLWRRRALEARMREEMEHHLAEQAAAHERAGLSPQDAAYAARRDFGHRDGVAEAIRDQRTSRTLEAIGRDLRLALRGLRRRPGFSAVVVVTLAIGLGTTTAALTLADAVLLRALPIAGEDRLVVLREFRTDEAERSYGVSYPNFIDWQQRLAPALPDLAIFGLDEISLATDEGTIRAPAAVVSASFFRTVGVSARLGRTFTEAEDRPGATGQPRSVLLSHQAWQRRHGSDPTIVGHILRIDRHPHVVIGVLPPALFPTAEEPVDYWITVATNGSIDQAGAGNASRNYRPYAGVVGRMADGITLARVRADAAVAHAELKARHAGLASALAVDVQPLREWLVGDLRAPLSLLMLTAAIVLLVACVNVANLLLARNATRQREFAIRCAVGASRGALVGHAVVEALVLAVLGGLTGFILSLWLVPGLVAALPDSIPAPGGLRPDLRVFGLAMLLAGLCALACGLLPGLAAARARPGDALKDGIRGGSTGPGAARFRRQLVGVQVALSTVLLVLAGLLIRSFQNLERSSPGYVTEHRLTAQLSLAAPRYFDGSFDPGPINRFLDELERRLTALPGVKAVGHAQSVPLTEIENSTSFQLSPGPESATATGEASVQLRFVSADYFTVLGIPVRDGRGFAEADRAGAEPVALVNEAFVRTHLGGSSAVGRSVKLGWGGNDPKRIVGVVGDVRHRSLSDSVRPEVYVPQAQFANASVTLVVVAAVPPETLERSVRATIQALDPDLPVTGLRTLDSYRAAALAEPRLFAVLLSGLGITALVLTLVGLYGSAGYDAAARTREIAIRLTLGASPRSVIGLVTRQGLRPVALGVIVGGGLSLLAARPLQDRLFGVGPGDWLSLAAVAFLCLATGAVACLIPAWRTSRVDPAVTLRQD